MNLQERWETLYTGHAPLVDDFPEFVTEDMPISTWDEFSLWERSIPSSCVFRGQAVPSHELSTTLERASYVDVTVNGKQTKLNSMKLCEFETLHYFKRAAHHFLSHLPNPEDNIEWLSLMQHHGAPTRLLDWSHSPYVALFFAIEKGESNESAIWVVDLDWLHEAPSKCLKNPDGSLIADTDALFNDTVSHLFHQFQPSVCVLETFPKRFNERMIPQQGTFLTHVGNVPRFQAALLETLVKAKPIVARPVIRRAIIKPRSRLEFIERLVRMNITAASLFPGLDGFARSLQFEVAMRVERFAGSFGRRRS